MDTEFNVLPAICSYPHSMTCILQYLNFIIHCLECRESVHTGSGINELSGNNSTLFSECSLSECSQYLYMLLLYLSVINHIFVHLCRHYLLS